MLKLLFVATMSLLKPALPPAEKLTVPPPAAISTMPEGSLGDNIQNQINQNAFISLGA